jgi:hypothetical protein
VFFSGLIDFVVQSFESSESTGRMRGGNIFDFGILMQGMISHPLHLFFALDRKAVLEVQRVFPNE